MSPRLRWRIAGVALFWLAFRTAAPLWSGDLAMGRSLAAAILGLLAIGAMALAEKAER